MCTAGFSCSSYPSLRGFSFPGVYFNNGLFLLLRDWIWISLVFAATRRDVCLHNFTVRIIYKYKCPQRSIRICPAEGCIHTECVSVRFLKWPQNGRCLLFRSNAPFNFQSKVQLTMSRVRLVAGQSTRPETFSSISSPSNNFVQLKIHCGAEDVLQKKGCQEGPAERVCKTRCRLNWKVNKCYCSCHQNVIFL